MSRSLHFGNRPRCSNQRRLLEPVRLIGDQSARVGNGGHAQQEPHRHAKCRSDQPGASRTSHRSCREEGRTERHEELMAARPVPDGRHFSDGEVRKDAKTDCHDADECEGEGGHRDAPFPTRLRRRSQTEAPAPTATPSSPLTLTARLKGSSRTWLGIGGSNPGTWASPPQGQRVVSLVHPAWGEQR